MWKPVRPRRGNLPTRAKGGLSVAGRALSQRDSGHSRTGLGVSLMVVGVTVGAIAAYWMLVVRRRPDIVLGNPPGPLPLLETWLNDHPKLRDAITWETDTGIKKYTEWSTLQKQELQDAFALAWNNGPYSNIVEPLPNLVHPPFSEYPETRLATGDAWSLFLSNLGHTFAAEIDKRVPWSIANYSSDQLAILLDSRQVFRWQDNVVEDGDAIGDKLSRIKGYSIQAEWVLPAHPGVALEFLHSNELIGTSRLQTIGKLISWCGRNGIHYEGGPNTLNMMNHWQYRGLPPVSRTISGTTRTDKPQAGLNHWIRGCAGMTDFMRAVLRIMNIPVAGVHVCDHSLTHFPTEGKYLSHGDDPYVLKKSPKMPGEKLLIDQAKFDAWFGPNVPEDTRCDNVGRAVQDL